MAGVPGPKWLLRHRRVFLNTVGLGQSLPAKVRPSIIIQRRAISRGLLGQSNFWRLVAVLLVLRAPVEGTFGRRQEHLATYRIRDGHSIRVTTAKPVSRRQRKELGLTKAKLRSDALTEIQDPNFRP